MQSLDWDEYEVVECLGVVPEVEEYETAYTYTVETDTHRLRLRIHPLENLVLVTLHQKAIQQAVIEMGLVVRGKVRYIKDKRGEYLSFGRCVVGPVFGCSTFAAGVCHNDNAFQDMNCELSVTPGIQVRFV